MARLEKFTKCNLKQLLKNKGYTYKVLSEKLGVTYQQVQKYSDGTNEMSLKALLECCKVLDCTPADIYPEIELYHRGFDIPKTQTVLQDENAKVVNVTHNHYPKSGLLEVIESFFSNIKLLDINKRGALLIKAGIIIIAFYLIGFWLFRAIGFSATDLATQLKLTLTVWEVVIGGIAPLLINSIFSYVLSFAALKMVFNNFYYLFLVGNIANNNTVDSRVSFWLTLFVGFILTLIYAYIVRKYLRKADIPVKS